MKSLVIIFRHKAEVNEDCLSVYMENNMCCYHEVTLGSKETKECVEKPVTDSGYYYITHSRISRQQEKMNGIHFLVQLI